MLITFAAQAGIGLELAEHRKDAQRLALFEDRDRIARDLHDLVIQRLFATGMSLQGSSGLIADPEAANRVRQAVDALDETIRDIRSAIFTLQSRPQARPAGIRARILAIVGEMTDSLGFAPSVRMEERLDALVPARDSRAHAGGAARGVCPTWPGTLSAGRVSVAVTAGSDLTLTVRDDGTGMKRSSRRSGLGNLADRASQLGGTLRVGRRRGRGHRARVARPATRGRSGRLSWLVTRPGGFAGR